MHGSFHSVTSFPSDRLTTGFCFSSLDDDGCYDDNDEKEKYEKEKRKEKDKTKYVPSLHMKMLPSHLLPGIIHSLLHCDDCFQRGATSPGHVARDTNVPVRVQGPPLVKVNAIHQCCDDAVWTRQVWCLAWVLDVFVAQPYLKWNGKY